MASKNMIRRVVTQSVTVVRDGERVTPEIGSSFEFTPEEIAYLDRISPAASRKPVNEAPLLDSDDEDADVENAPPAKDTKPGKATKPAKAAQSAPAAAKPETSSEDDDI